MSAARGALAAFALCALVAGCASPGSTTDIGATAMQSTTRTVSSRDLRGAIITGKSTRTNLLDALGSTTVIRFDSGYEVWVYRTTGEEAADVDAGRPGAAPGTGKAGPAKPAETEFLVLLSPRGIVTRTRIRPPPPARGTQP